MKKIAIVIMLISLVFLASCSNNTVSITDTIINDEGHMIISYSDGTQKDVGLVVGEDGLNGQDGMNGEDGQNGLDGSDGTHGIDGQDGQSAYDLYIEEHPDYSGTVEEWISEFFTNPTIEEYEVTFNQNNGLDSFTQNILEGQHVMRPEPPTKLGYTFLGWHLNTYDVEWVFEGFVVSQELILNAKWSVNQYTISFEEDGGSDVADIIQDYDTAVLAPEQPFKIGHTFSGWYSDAALLNPYAFSTMPAEDITLYAKWEINQYNIIYAVYDDYDLLVDPVLGYNNTIVSAALGHYHSTAVTSEGQLFIWGYNNYGQLGDGTTTQSLIPMDITSQLNLSDGETVVCSDAGELHTGAVTSDGRLFMWGANIQGQLGDSSNTDSSVPIDITSQFGLHEGEKIVQVALSNRGSSALTSEGRVFMWGYNGYGQIGDGTTTERNYPVEITANFDLAEGETITTLSLDGSGSSAFSSNGRVFTWGANNLGQVGDGTTTHRQLPVDITTQFSLNVGETITLVSLGEDHSVALTSDGRLFTWGYNFYGQLGDGTTTTSLIPIDVTSNLSLEEGETVVDSFSGYRFTSAVTSLGRLFMWGENGSGKLGDGTMIASVLPKDITAQFDLQVGETLSMPILGHYHSAVLTSKGQLYVWGMNSVGQLGVGVMDYSFTPIQTRLRLPTLFEVVYDYDQLIYDFEPIRNGYTFEGWYLDKELTIPYTFTTMPANDIVVYGRWV